MIYICPKYNVKNHFTFTKWWNDFLRSHEEYKIVHGHLMGSASIYLSIAKKHGRITISHSHNVAATKFTPYYVASRIYQFPIRKIADYCLACSEESGKYLFGRNVMKSKKFLIVQNGIDINRFQYSDAKRINTREKYNIKNELTIGNVARLCYQKNYSFLLDIVKEIKNYGYAVKCLIVGTGPDLEMLKSKAYYLDIMDNIIFVGARSDPESYYCAMDVFICPSHFEGLSIATVEAQATGLVSVVSEGVPERANIGAGIYKKMMLSYGAKRWAQEIIKIIKNRNNTRTSQSQKVREAGFDIHETSKILTEFYKML